MKSTFVTILRKSNKVLPHNNINRSPFRYFSTTVSNLNSVNQKDNNNIAISSLTRPLPPSWYSSESHYQIERQHIFGPLSNNWLYAGSLNEIPTIGNYKTITIADFPILLYRYGPNLTDISSYFNICSHRAGPLFTPNSLGSSSANLFRCKYHGWCFNPVDGKLKSTPQFGCTFTDKDKTDNNLNLKSLQIEIWRNQFIFVNLAPANSTNLTAKLAPILSDLDSEMSSFPLADYTQFSHRSHIINCNWKTYVENYQEGYHIKTIHPALNKAVDSNSYTVTSKKDFYSIHSAPGKNQTSKQSKYLWLYLYPNLAINLYEDVYSIENIVPLGKDKTELRYQFFSHNSLNATESETVKNSMEDNVILTNEDQEICEQVQTNLNSGIYQPGFLSPLHEGGVKMFQQNLKKALKGHTQIE